MTRRGGAQAPDQPRVREKQPNCAGGGITSWVKPRLQHLLRGGPEAGGKRSLEVTVTKDGSSDYTTIAAALVAAPNGKARYTIRIREGTYIEQFNVTRHNVALFGYGMGKTVITGNPGTPQGGYMPSSATVRTVDFIFGNAKAVFQSCCLLVRRPKINGAHNVVTAQGRNKAEDDHSGFSFQNCSIMAMPKENLTGVEMYLGRPWRNYSHVIFMESFLRLGALGKEPYRCGDDEDGYSKVTDAKKAEEYTIDCFINGS
ncbi:hypothetical protein E2562_003658 [Oryza meyeriana var. granulata]|uniref:Pectinesterase catalytic domain-containing protein n=1 Tax=Oryza meyeriana var. granulata TaxID=110450 RepID=A0A6G1C4M7_9ORYZ|nr:hypothetical protein E2562_003658 [Oryza meyeriana var. granulata]